MPALAFAIQLLEEVPALIAAGRDISSLIANGNAALKAMQNEGRDPTDAEWTALNAEIKSLQDDLNS